MLSRPLHRYSGRLSSSRILSELSKRRAENDRASPFLRDHTREVARELEIDKAAVSMFDEEDRLIYTSSTKMLLRKIISSYVGASVFGE